MPKSIESPRWLRYGLKLNWQVRYSDMSVRSNIFTYDMLGRCKLLTSGMALWRILTGGMPVRWKVNVGEMLDIHATNHIAVWWWQLPERVCTCHRGYQYMCAHECVGVLVEGAAVTAGSICSGISIRLLLNVYHGKLSAYRTHPLTLPPPASTTFYISQ